MCKTVHQVLFLILFLSSFLISGCSTTLSQPAIKDMGDDKVIVRYQYEGMFGVAPSQESIELEAQRGCELYGKVATEISKSCVQNPGFQIICDHLFACYTE